MTCAHMFPPPVPPDRRSQKAAAKTASDSDGDKEKNMCHRRATAHAHICAYCTCTDVSAILCMALPNVTWLSSCDGERNRAARDVIRLSCMPPNACSSG